jgi:hypothetical protein
MLVVLLGAEAEATNFCGNDTITLVLDLEAEERFIAFCVSIGLGPFLQFLPTDVFGSFDSSNVL